MVFLLKNIGNLNHGHDMLTPIQALSISTMPARHYTPSPWWTNLLLR